MATGRELICGVSFKSEFEMLVSVPLVPQRRISHQAPKTILSRRSMMGS
jgi:hypothetical protein